MSISTTIDGTTVVIRPRGEIDFDTLPNLLATAQKLPQSVTEVVWDLREAQFMDVSALHLLVHQRLACQEANRTLTVTGLSQQPQRLLQLAQELFPADQWSDFFPSGLSAAVA
ncbi:STAS domain-containing protein [Streptomyces beigongshangae]|uniref:STAS domain-containing protein n=1 Tax=Streptomyces beigongshangae TaxID=2841597 RepID=UPI001C85FA5F|nr:STAS domain-containing protein [Streptomyces sp. REN17]